VIDFGLICHVAKAVSPLVFKYLLLSMVTGVCDNIVGEVFKALSRLRDSRVINPCYMSISFLTSKEKMI
jgi:hypothetical protein